MTIKADQALRRPWPAISGGYTFEILEKRDVSQAEGVFLSLGDDAREEDGAVTLTKTFREEEKVLDPLSCFKRHTRFGTQPSATCCGAGQDQRDRGRLDPEVRSKFFGTRGTAPL